MVNQTERIAYLVTMSAKHRMVQSGELNFKYLKSIFYILLISVIRSQYGKIAATI